MTPQELRDRTAGFARDVRALAEPLLLRIQTCDIGRQLLRASSSVASNYRAAGRARSHKEFVAKIGLVLEEADESEFWLTHLQSCGLVKTMELDALTREAGELISIFAKSKRTANQRRREKDHRRRPRRPRGETD